MSDDDLTSLRAEFNEILAEHAPPSRVNSKEGWAECGCGERFTVNFVDPEMGYYEDEWETHCAHVASALVSSPTVAALIDRVERAERERDELRATYNNVWAWWMKAVERAKAAEEEVRRLGSLNLLREMRKTEVQGAGEQPVRGDSDGQV